MRSTYSPRQQEAQKAGLCTDCLFGLLCITRGLGITKLEAMKNYRKQSDHFINLSDAYRFVESKIPCFKRES